MVTKFFIVFLIIHVLGDYYFQTEKMAEEKNEKLMKLIHHSLIYFIVVGICIIPIGSFQIALYAVGIAAFHFMIDFTKYLLFKISEKMRSAKLSKFLDRENERGSIYVIDQILHIISLYILSYIISFETFSIEFFKIWDRYPMESLRIVFMFLLILKPVNVTFRKLMGHYKPASEINEIDDTRRVGKLIGKLERMLVLVFLLLNQYTAIGLVFTAKSITRYDKISHDEVFAEYYLLGTLFSILSTVLIYLVINNL